MEESVQKLLKSRGWVELPAVDAEDVANAYGSKLSEDVREQQVTPKGNSQMTNALESPGDGGLAEEDADKAKHLQERLQLLQAENSALAMENEARREQYERRLDEVAAHIVQALLTQKELREERLLLQTRVLDLEQQNWILSGLFQQGLPPASHLLLEKLQSKITDLSRGDALLGAERTKNVQLSRSLGSSQHESPPGRVAGFPTEEHPSRVGLAVPAGAHSYSSGSGSGSGGSGGSELSLSSACSECSNGSFSWREGRSCNKLSSFTCKKRVGFGTPAPGDTCRLSEERLWPPKKEWHILAGLKMLRRYSGKKQSCRLHSTSGYKDYMKSNEGIYSLGSNARKKSTGNPFQIGKLSRLPGSQDGIRHDSDDAVESPCDVSDRHNICVKDCCNRNESNTFRAWKCNKNDMKNVEQMRCNPTNLLSAYNAKDFTEKLLSFSNIFESRTTASDNLSSAVLHLKAEPQLHGSDGQLTEELERDLKKLPKWDKPLTSPSSQSPASGKAKRATENLYNAPSPLGCHSDTNESSVRGLRNISAPHVADKASTQQHGKKKAQTFENGPVRPNKTSSSLPAPVQEHFRYIAVSQEPTTKIPQPASSYTHLKADCRNSRENGSKIPLSSKGFVKSPLSLVKNPTAPLKHEKDHINTASKGKNALNEWDTKQRTREKSKLGRRGGARCQSTYRQQLLQVLPEKHSAEDGIVGGIRLESSLASGKLDLKPASGAKGAKARSQSLSDRDPEEPSRGTPGGAGKVQKRIITNMGERGNFLSRQHSFASSFPLTSLSRPEEIPADCPCGQADPHEATGSGSQSALAGSKNRAGSITKSEADRPLSQNEVNSFTFGKKFGLRSSGQPIKALPRSSSDSLPFPACQGNEGTGNPPQSPIRVDLVTNNAKRVNGDVSDEKPGTSLSPSASAIEEKVMMGIEENVQKCQGRDKREAPESKRKAALSLANWFGFCKSKLPALSGKKTDPPKGKRANAGARTTSAGGARQAKADRKKDHKRNGTEQKDSQEVHIWKASNKVDPAMSARNIRTGNASHEIRHQTSCTGKDPFIKDDFNRLAKVTQQTKNGSKLLSSRSEAHRVPISNQDIRKKMSRNKLHVEALNDSTAKTVRQKINRISENEERPAFKAAFEDRATGFLPQMDDRDLPVSQVVSAE